MGIDYGTKRVGIALTDDGGNMAFPHDVFLNDTTLIGQVEALVKEKEVEKVVVGKSVDLNGSPNVVQKSIERFVDELRERIDANIVFEPEQYTTREAHHIQGKTSKTDASAAAIILNSFLTKNSKNE